MSMLAICEYERRLLAEWVFLVALRTRDCKACKYSDGSEMLEYGECDVNVAF
jgi:hypothetical protein